MAAVLVGKLAMLVAIVEIHRIIQSVALLIRLLDASAARRSLVFLARSSTTAGINDEISLLQELVGYLS